jgi:cystathionine beta-lyase
VLLISGRADLADLAGRTLLDSGRTEVFVIDGGFPALAEAGAGIGTCAQMDLSTACDITSFAHGRHEGDKDASRLYLAWEKGLVAQLGNAERAAFRL